MPSKPSYEISDEERHGLLQNAEDVDPQSASTPSATRPPSRLHPSGRQSSFSKRASNGAPRTPNRVRFDIQEDEEENRLLNGQAGQCSAGQDIENDLSHDETASRRASTGQRAPLLTGIEAPSVVVANELDFDPADHLENARPRSGLRSAFTNMANSIVGAGIIGQPYAFKQAGLITGVILLIGLTITVDWTIRLIVINSKLSGADTFQGTMQHCFGRSGLIAISVAQWAFAFGGMMAYCIIVGDTIPAFLGSLFPGLSDMPFLWLLTNRRAMIILFILGLSYPLSLYRDIAKLAKASGLALVSMTVIIVTIITQGARLAPELKGSLNGLVFVGGGIPQAVGIISFAFVCHHNSLLIYGSLRTPTLDRFAQVTHYSTFVSMLACMAVALAGFLAFGDKTVGNVLNNFPTDNLMVNIARLCFGLNMLSTLPLECFVCREVMFNYWFPNEPFNMNLHMIFTTALIVTAMSMALITDDLGVIFELVGATSACALAYILPPLCYIKLSRRSWRTVMAYICVSFGAIVMVMSLLMNFRV